MNSRPASFAGRGDGVTLFVNYTDGMASISFSVSSEVCVDGTAIAPYHMGHVGKYTFCIAENDDESPYFPEYPPPHTVIVLELDERPLFVSYPVELDAADLREGMVLSLR